LEAVGTFAGEPDPFDVTVTATDLGPDGDGRAFRAVLENGTGAEGGEVTLRISDTALASHDLHACLDEFEHWVNATLGREYRLGAVLAMGELGPFRIFPSGETGLYVLAPNPGVSDLAA
jgi:hypothetical protein